MCNCRLCFPAGRCSSLSPLLPSPSPRRGLPTLRSTATPRTSLAPHRPQGFPANRHNSLQLNLQPGRDLTYALLTGDAAVLPWLPAPGVPLSSSSSPRFVKFSTSSAEAGAPRAAVPPRTLRVIHPVVFDHSVAVSHVQKGTQGHRSSGLLTAALQEIKTMG